MALQAPKRIELGEGRYAILIANVWTGEEGYTGEAVGLIETHPRPDGTGTCQGLVVFRGMRDGEKIPKDGPEWDILQEDPLTLSPSILCRICGNHGFIRNGKWEGD